MRYDEKGMKYPIRQNVTICDRKCSTSLCRLECATAIHIKDVSLFLILTTNSIELHFCIN